MKNESIDKLAKKLADSVPEGLRAARDDVEQNFRSVLRAGLAKLDLVTREEFEVQEAVLARTRQQHDALQARLTALEATLSTQATPRKPAVRKKSASKKKAD